MIHDHIYFHNVEEMELTEKGYKLRKIVEKYAKERLIYTNGLDLMGQEIYVSADLTHPTTEGLEEIASNWGQIMKQYENFL